MDDGTGYRKPPKHTQFKKGISGNPSGRPKNKTTILTYNDFNKLFLNIANKRVKAQINNEVVEISMMKAAINKIFHEAMKGNIPATRMLLSEMRKAHQFHDSHAEEIIRLQYRLADLHDKTDKGLILGYLTYDDAIKQYEKLGDMIKEHYEDDN